MKQQKPHGGKQDSIRTRGVQMLAADRLREIAERDHTTVYEYEPDDDDEKHVPAREVRAFVERARQLAAEIRTEPAWADKPDDAVRHEILRREPAMKPLCVPHGKMFELMTASNTTPLQAARIGYLLYIQEQVDDGVLTKQDGDAAAVRFMQRMKKEDDSAAARGGGGETK